MDDIDHVETPAPVPPEVPPTAAEAKLAASVQGVAVQHEVNRIAGELCDAIQRARDAGVAVTLPFGIEQLDRIVVKTL